MMFVLGAVVVVMEGRDGHGSPHGHIIGPYKHFLEKGMDEWIGFLKTPPTCDSLWPVVGASVFLPSELPLASHSDAYAGDTTINISLKSARSLFCPSLGSTFSNMVVNKFLMIF